MSLKKLIGFLFGRKEAPEVSLRALAQFPIFLMLRGEGPFANWHPNDIQVPPALTDTYRGAVWVYQVFTFKALVATRFGSDVSDLTLDYQVEQLESIQPGMGTQLRAGIGQIFDTLASRHAHTPIYDKEKMKLIWRRRGNSTGSNENDPMEVPVEYQIAMQWLISPEDAPYHVSREDFANGIIPDFHDDDWRLAMCLEYGKGVALQYFEPAVRDAKVTLSTRSG